MSAARVRRAVPADMPRLIEMGRRFVAESEYAALIALDPERMTGVIVNTAASPDGAIFVSEAGDKATGMIAMLAFDHPYSGERVASELVWWVDPEARGDGLRLLRAAEQWGRETGAKKILMVAPNDRVGALYERLGYAPVETAYQRSL